MDIFGYSVSFCPGLGFQYWAAWTYQTSCSNCQSDLWCNHHMWVVVFSSFFSSGLSFWLHWFGPLAVSKGLLSYKPRVVDGSFCAVGHTRGKTQVKVQTVQLNMNYYSLFFIVLIIMLVKTSRHSRFLTTVISEVGWVIYAWNYQHV